MSEPWEDYQTNKVETPPWEDFKSQTSAPVVSAPSEPSLPRQLLESLYPANIWNNLVERPATAAYNLAGKAFINVPANIYRMSQGLPNAERILGVPGVQSTLPFKPIQSGQSLLDVQIPDAEVNPISAAVQGAVNSLATPGGIATLPISGSENLLSRAIRALYTGQMGEGVVQGVKTALDSNLPTFDRIKGGTDAALAGAGVAGLGQSLYHGASPTFTGDMAALQHLKDAVQYKLNAEPTANLKPGDVLDTRDLRYDQPGGGDIVPESRQLPQEAGPSAPSQPRYAVDPLGQAIDLSQLSPREQAELYRPSAMQYVPREQYVRPAQESPAILPPPIEIPRREVLIYNRSRPIEGGLGETIKAPEESGGEVSFRGPAKAEGMPSARQSALPIKFKELEPTKEDLATGQQNIYDTTKEQVFSFRTEKQKLEAYVKNRTEILKDRTELSKQAEARGLSTKAYKDLLEENNANNLKRISELVEPTKPEIVKLGTSSRKNPQGDPIGTTYRASLDDYKAYQEAQSGLKKLMQEDPSLEKPDTAGKIRELMQENERVKNKYGGVPPEEPKVERGKTGKVYGGIPLLDPDFYKETGSKLVALAKSAAPKERVSQLLDAADNFAKISARQLGNRIRSALPDEADRKALTFVIESGGDKAKLKEFEFQAAKNSTALQSIRYARANFTRLLPHAQEVRRILDQQRANEIGNKVNTDEAPNYIKHTYEDRKNVFFDAGGSGVSTSFKKQRTFATYADAIESGYKPSTFDSAALVESRIAAGNKMVNRIKWGEALAKISDPSTGDPITAAMITQPKGTQVAPKGYQPREILPGVRVAVQDGYTGIFDALTGKSFVSNSLVGRGLLQTEGAIKHGLLMIDTFHASRVLQKELFLTGKAGYNKGLSVLEYDDPTINRLVSRGDMTKEQAAWVRTKRPTADLLVKNGLNVGRIAEAIYSDVVRKEIKVLGKDINIPGKFTKWVFDKVTRGAMMESALYEFERTKKNNPSWSEEQVAGHVAKQINVYFGNLGRQGILKSASAQDLARLTLLAPQWVEGMVQTELRAAKQTLQIPYDAATEQTLKVGTAAKGVGTGLLAYFIGTQLLNKYTTGHFTWENEDKDHKLDAFIPDPTGKSGGYWVSPFSVAGEVTHDWMRYSKSKENQLQVAAQIFQNKLSPLARSFDTIRTGRDFTGAKLLGSGEVLKQVGKSLLPVPLPLAGTTTDQPGAVGRQLLGSTGLKVEIANQKEKKLNDLSESKFGKDYSLLNIRERAQVAKELPKEPRTLQQSYAIAQKATDNQFNRTKEVNDSLSKENQDFLKRNGHTLPPVEPYVTRSGVKVPLSKEEVQKLEAVTIKFYEQEITELRSREGFDSKSEKAKARMFEAFEHRAKNKARSELGYPRLR